MPKKQKKFSEMTPAEKVKSRALVGQYVVKHPETHEHSRTFASAGISNHNDLAEFKEDFTVDIISYEKDEKYGEDTVQFDMVGVDAPIANTLRRVLIAEVPTVAIERVLLYNNTSVIQDEVLAHRLGLIPLHVNPKMFDFKTKEEDDTATNTVMFKLEVECTRKAATGTADEMYEGHIVTSSDLIWIPLEGQEELFGDDPPRPVHPDILIAKMRPGQVIDLEVKCVRGIGKDHAKFSPVATATYRLHPEVEIVSEVTGGKAQELVDICPLNVFDIEDIKGVSTAVVARPRDCTMCRECIRADEWNERVQLRRIKNHFIFTVESTGVVPARELVVDALSVMKEKCQRYLDVLTPDP